jgi:brefeldin A-resistance guanine nucleotide exchange factor 1
MDQFDFQGQRVDEALRQILNSFRLPGESALIERIITVFSEKYFDTARATEVADKDAIFVLTYAIIMLNTDQYNPNVKAANRMTYTDFSRNLRGVNGGNDFEPQYLQDIYESIKTREIVLPEEHDNKHAFEHAWKELLVKTQTSERLTICTNTNIYDAEMFAATWRPIVATLNYVFVSATEDAVFQRVTTGYRQLAQIAAKYSVHECLDHIILSLSKISTLAVDGASTALNTEIVAQGKSIMVSKFAVDFGRNVQAERATLVLFRVINGCEGVVREGWNPVSHETSIRKGLQSYC